MSFETALQKAISDVLTAYTALTDVASVHDDVDQETPYPYVILGDDSFSDRSTDTNTGRSALVVIHTWSVESGKKETKEIQGHVSDALERAELTGAGFNFVTIDLQSSISFMDADGKRRHGIQEFSCQIEKL